MSRASIGWVRKLSPGGQREHRHALDQVHEQAKRARARADHDRGAQGQRVGHGVAAGCARPASRLARWRERPAPVRPAAARARRGTRSGARPRARRPRRSAPPRSARARRTACAAPGASPSSGSGSRRPRRRPVPACSPSPVSASPRSTRTLSAYTEACWRASAASTRSGRARARARRVLRSAAGERAASRRSRWRL